MSESDSTKSYFLWCRVQDSSDALCHAVPLFGFAFRPALSGRGKPVILRLPIVFRLAPFASDPALVFQAIRRRIQRALLNLQTIFRNLLDAQQNAVAVQWAEGNGLEDQHVERTLQNVQLVVHESNLS